MPGPQRRALLLGSAALALPAAWLPGALAQPLPPPLAPRPLVFPRDHGTHNDSRTEWWYLTGHGQTASGRPFGFQVTFFRSRVDGTETLRSRLAARQLLFAHAAITDLQGQRLVHDERIARWNGLPPASPGQRGAYALEADTHVRLQDWFIWRQPDGRYTVRIASEALHIELTARPTQPLLLQGEQGYSRKGPEPEQASFYVSKPQLAVSGHLALGGERFELPQGTAWLDHEWSETLMHPEAVGWDWVGMNLFNGDALTAFRLRRADGSAVWAGGSWRRAGQREAQTFAADAVRFEPLRHWTSPLTQARYPVAWALQTPAGRFEVQALLDAQELDSRRSTGTVYWEGLSDLRDAQGQTVGRGYLEMTGYAGRLRL